MGRYLHGYINWLYKNVTGTLYMYCETVRTLLLSYEYSKLQKPTRVVFTYTQLIVTAQ